MVVMVMMVMMILIVMVLMVVSGIYGTILGARVKADTLVGPFLPMTPTSSRLWR